MLTKEMTDDELVYLTIEGSKIAETALYQRYQEHANKLGKYFYKEYKRSGISEDEFAQVAYSTIPTVLLSFKKRYHEDFYRYWRKAAQNAIYDYIKDNSYAYGARALGDISFDEHAYYDNDRLLIHDVITSNEDSSDIASIVRDLIEFENKVLTDEEREIAHYRFIKQKDVSEIATLLNQSDNHVKYVIGLVRKKLKKKINSVI